jgi:hypothetical protein
MATLTGIVKAVALLTQDKSASVFPCWRAYFILYLFIIQSTRLGLYAPSALCRVLFITVSTDTGVVMKDVTLPLGGQTALSSGEIKPQGAELAPQQSQLLNLIVTNDDHYWSERSGLRNPILCALQRHTKTLWRLYNDGLALEAMPPYRACQLPDDAVKKWQQWQITGELPDPEWEVELVANVAQDGYSMIQHRSTNLHSEILRRCRASTAPVMEVALSRQKSA